MPAPTAYAELHCLSNYSFLTGASHPEELVMHAHELGYAALALTDECSLAGVVRAHSAAKECGLSLILGSEIRLADGQRLVLLACDREGYGNLSELITLGRRRADKGGYRLERADLAAGLDHCLALWLAGDESRSGDGCWLADAFPHRCWIAVELHRSGGDGERLQRLRALGAATGLPLVATGGVLMHERGRKPLQDSLTAIRLNVPLSRAGHALQPNAERHLRSLRDLGRFYPPDLLEETVRVAGLCRFSLDELRYEYPSELVPPGVTASDHLRRLTEEGMLLRWPGGAPPKVRRLIGYELALIAELKYEPYFLTVHDIVRFARGRGILCQGRGSAANSAVCYCLGITEVDPARMEVLFERFISKERNEPPDIDVDFEHQRREEVLQYIYAKYGRHRAALAATIITYRPKSAVRDLGKALGLDPDQVDRLARSIAWWDGREIADERLREAGLDPRSPVVRRVLALVAQIQGFPRHLSQHVGGMVISRGPISRLVPVENAAMAGRTLIQWDKDDLDALGLLKVDCLALGMLSAIRRAFDLINGYYGRMHAGPRQAEAAVLPRMDANEPGVEQGGLGEAGRPPTVAQGCGSCDYPQSEVISGPMHVGHRCAQPNLRDEPGPFFVGAGYSGHPCPPPFGPRPARSRSFQTISSAATEESPVGWGERREPQQKESSSSRHVDWAEQRKPQRKERSPSQADIGYRCVAPDAWNDPNPPPVGAGYSGHPCPPLFGPCLARSRSFQTISSAATPGGISIGHERQDGPDRSPTAAGPDGLMPSPLGLHNIPPEDPEVYAMIQRAETTGVFQIESRAQMAMLPRLKPACFYDLVIEVAIVRPGPIQGDMVHPYLRRRQGLEPVDYPSGEVRGVLGRTLGVPIFQEQVIKVAQVAAGFTPGEADRLRRSIGAWRRRGTLEQFEQRLVDGMRARGYEERFARQIYQQICGFGEYGFPESHAASFALLVYVSAWLKHHHPAAFFAALVNSQPMGFYAPAQLIREARRQDVTVRPVDVRVSDWDCALESSFAIVGRGERSEPRRNESAGVKPDAGHRCAQPNLPEDRGASVPILRLGLCLVKGLSRDGAARIESARADCPFDSLKDLARRADLDRRDLDALAAAGALRGLSGDRHQAAWQVMGHQPELPLFADTAEAEAPVDLPPPTAGQDIVADYASLGLSLAPHPLALLRPRLRHLGLLTADEVRELSHGTPVRTGGIVINRQHPASAKGVVFVTLEDETGQVNLVVWQRVAQRQRRILLGASLMEVVGEVQREGEVVHVVAKRLRDHSPLLGALQVTSRDFR